MQINTAKGILDTILSVQPKESTGGKPGETREAIVYKIAEDMLRKLPRDYVPHEIKESLIRLAGLLPMNIFLRQEIDRMQKILTIGKSSSCLLDGGEIEGFWNSSRHFSYLKTLPSSDFCL